MKFSRRCICFVTNLLAAEPNMRAARACRAAVVQAHTAAFRTLCKVLLRMHRVNCRLSPVIDSGAVEMPRRGCVVDLSGSRFNALRFANVVLEGDSGHARPPGAHFSERPNTRSITRPQRACTWGAQTVVCHELIVTQNELRLSQRLSSDISEDRPKHTHR